MAGPAKPALCVHPAWMASVVNINDVLEGHVALETECVDRLLLNAYVAHMQVPGQTPGDPGGNRLHGAAQRVRGL